MEWTFALLCGFVGVVLAGVAAVGVMAVMQQVEVSRRRARIRAEQYRAELELQHLTQRAMTEMLQAARLDARLRPTAPPRAGRVTPSPDDIAGEVWDPHD